MAHLGLVPSERTSAEKTRRGGITKTGNIHARRAMIEAAWAYRLPARVSRQLLKRQEDVPDEVCRIAWQAQLRFLLTSGNHISGCDKNTFRNRNMFLTTTNLRPV